MIYLLINFGYTLGKNLRKKVVINYSLSGKISHKTINILSIKNIKSNSCFLPKHNHFLNAKNINKFITKIYFD